ncbi:hypothetical protein GCM10023259_079280 [Thermocatellispora tengchongensis]
MVPGVVVLGAFLRRPGGVGAVPGLAVVPDLEGVHGVVACMPVRVGAMGFGGVRALWACCSARCVRSGAWRALWPGPPVFVPVQVGLVPLGTVSAPGACACSGTPGPWP